MTELHFASATTIAAQIRDRRLSAREALEHFLARVDALNPRINAIIWTDAAHARRAADAADAAQARGAPLGPLHGVPMTIKESFQWRGSPTTWGIPALENNCPASTALAVSRLEAAGAVVFGKTNVPKQLADWQSYNAIYGTTNNPWDVTRHPGGSSGGSAAALAAGLTGCDIGSDIGASIRNPAHFCGVFGLKPTFGIVPVRRHTLPGVDSISDIAAAGPMARSASDIRTMLDIIATPDELDAACWRVDLPRPKASRLSEFRVAVKLEDPNSEIDAAYAEKLEAFVRALEKAGAKVTRKEPAIDTRRLHDVYVHLLRAATSRGATPEDITRWRAALDAAGGPSAEPYLAQVIAGNTLTHRDWLHYDNVRAGFRYAFAEFFRDVDVLICPAAASATTPHDHTGERWQRKIEINGKRVHTTDQLFWAGYPGVVYLPALVAPLGPTRTGLPVGYQAIAAHGHDHTAITFAECVEREIGGFVPPPGF